MQFRENCKIASLTPIDESNNPSGTRIIRARIFTTKWNIRLDGTFCFPDPKIENGMLLLPLNTRFNVSRPRSQ